MLADGSTLETESRSQTDVSFGQDYIVHDKIEVEEREIEKLKSTLTKTDNEIRLSEKNGVPQAVQQARSEKLKILKSIEKRTERLFWLRERFEHHFPSEIVVRGTVYPGVSIESHGRTLEIHVERRGAKFTFDERSGRIEETNVGTHEE